MDAQRYPNTQQIGVSATWGRLRSPIGNWNLEG